MRHPNLHFATWGAFLSRRPACWFCGRRRPRRTKITKAGHSRAAARHPPSQRSPRRTRPRIRRSYPLSLCPTSIFDTGEHLPCAAQRAVRQSTEGGSRTRGAREDSDVRTQRRARLHHQHHPLYRVLSEAATPAPRRERRRWMFASAITRWRSARGGIMDAALPIHWKGSWGASDAESERTDTNAEGWGLTMRCVGAGASVYVGGS